MYVALYFTLQFFQQRNSKVGSVLDKLAATDRVEEGDRRKITSKTPEATTE